MLVTFLSLVQTHYCCESQGLQLSPLVVLKDLPEPRMLVDLGEVSLMSPCLITQISVDLRNRTLPSGWKATNSLGNSL